MGNFAVSSLDKPRRFPYTVRVGKARKGADSVEKRDFFISYTNTDEVWAIWIANVLKANGYSAYVQVLDIGPGDNFLEKMNEFLKNSKNFIAIWSKDYSKSWYCMKEMEAAFKACHEKRMDSLLPVRLDRYPVEPLYSALVYVDLSNMNAASERKLMDAVRRNVSPHALVTPSAPKPLETTPDKPIQRYGSTFYQWAEISYLAKDYVTARMYYEQAAEGDNASALYRLGLLHESGKGVQRDYIKAMDYWKRAAAKGNADALFGLGFLYDLGRGIQQNYAKARDYYTQAAAKGHAKALYNLGVLYEYGEGVRQNYDTALEYYAKAAKAGVRGSYMKICKLFFLSMWNAIKEAIREELKR